MRVAGLELVLLGDERSRRRVQAADHHVDVRRQRGDHVPRMAQGGSALVQAPEQEAEVHHRAGLVQLELELRHDREVAAAAAQCPEQVGVLLLGRHQHVAGGRHDAGGEQVVDRQPVLAAQPPHAAAEREPADAGVADQPDGHRQAVRLGRRVEVAEQGTAADPHPARVRVDDHLVHGTEVDHEAVVHDGRARHAVRPAAHGHLEAVGSGEPDGCLHVRLVGTSRDGERAAVDGRVPDAATLVVRRVVGADDLATQSAAKVVDRGARGLGHGVPPSGARGAREH